MSKSESQLKAEIETLREQLDAIERERQERHNRTYIGRYFKYNNGYDNTERWWMYVMITGVNGQYLKGTIFQHMSDGRIEIHKDDGIFIDVDNYDEIEADEYEQAWQYLVAEIIQLGRVGGKQEALEAELADIAEEK